MQSAYEQRIAFSVPIAGATAVYTLESNLNDDEVLNPSLVFVNFGTEAVELTIVRRIDLGVSADPEDNGTLDETVVDAVSIAVGESYTYEPDFKNLIVKDSTPSVEHLITLDGSNLPTTAINIVQLFVSGQVEETSRTNILSYERSS